VRNLMMKQPLTITSLMEYAEVCHGSQEVISLTGNDKIDRLSYKEVFRRVRKLASIVARTGSVDGME